MLSSGLFITLFDKETLDLYLSQGVYGELREPVFNEVSSRSMHYAALADAACARNGTHVFFFLERTIFYGGQIIGSNDFGAYYLNSPYSPMGRRADAGIYWNESDRGIYAATDRPGIFLREGQPRCQPYLLLFEDRLGLKGRAIESDVLYSELSFWPYPLPSNSIRGVSFCTITPYETVILLELLRQKGEGHDIEPVDNIELQGDPVGFRSELGIDHLSQATSKYHHDAMILSNPTLLPPELRNPNAAICRKVPISPHKPSAVDRADVCYYTDEPIREGTLPNVILELEWKPAGNTKLKKMVRYIRWLQRVASEEWTDISFNLLAPRFKDRVWRDIPTEYRDYINLIRWRA